MKKYFLLFAVGILWGSQFIFQKMALRTLSPEWVGVLRTITGFLALAVFCRLAGFKKKGGTSWWMYAVIGLFEASIPFVLIPWGQQFVSVSETSILIGTIPFFVMLLSPLVFLDRSTLSIPNILSIVVGFSGLIILFFPEITIKTREAVSVTGVLAVLGAAASFAFALLLLNRFCHEHPVVAARNILGYASIQTLLITLSGLPQKFSITPVSLMAVLYLGVVCSSIVYMMYMVLIREAGPLFASFTNYLVPAFGVLTGVLFTHEKLGANVFLALAVIMIALMLNQMFQKSSTPE